MGIRRLGGIVLGDPGADELASLVEIDEQPLIAKLVPCFDAERQPLGIGRTREVGH